MVAQSPEAHLSIQSLKNKPVSKGDIINRAQIFLTQLSLDIHGLPMSIASKIAQVRQNPVLRGFLGDESIPTGRQNYPPLTEKPKPIRKASRFNNVPPVSSYNNLEYKDGINQEGIGGEDINRTLQNYQMQKSKFNHIIDKFAPMFGIDKNLVLAVIATESRFDATRMSARGAEGFMQLMPATRQLFVSILSDTKNIGYPSSEEKYFIHMRNQYMNPDRGIYIDALSPIEQNILLGMLYLSYLTQKFGIEKGLQIYNAGYKNIGKTQENKNYPDHVSQWKHVFDQISGREQTI